MKALITIINCVIGNRNLYCFHAARTDICYHYCHTIRRQSTSDPYKFQKYQKCVDYDDRVTAFKTKSMNFGLCTLMECRQCSSADGIIYAQTTAVGLQIHWQNSEFFTGTVINYYLLCYQKQCAYLTYYLLNIYNITWYKF